MDVGALLDAGKAEFGDLYGLSYPVDTVPAGCSQPVEFGTDQSHFALKVGSVMLAVAGLRTVLAWVTLAGFA
jgi:hypothetical protein